MNPTLNLSGLKVLRNFVQDICNNPGVNVVMQSIQKVAFKSADPTTHYILGFTYRDTEFGTHPAYKGKMFPHVHQTFQPTREVCDIRVQNPDFVSDEVNALYFHGTDAAPKSNPQDTFVLLKSHEGEHKNKYATKTLPVNHTELFPNYPQSMIDKALKEYYDFSVSPIQACVEEAAKTGAVNVKQIGDDIT